MQNKLYKWIEPQELKEKIKNDNLLQFVKDLSTVDDLLSIKKMRQLIFELLNSAIRKEITPEQCTTFFEKAVKLKLKTPEWWSDSIVEALWLISFDWDKNDQSNQDIKRAFIGIQQTLVSKSIVTQKLLMERLEENALNACQLISDLNQFTKKRIRINTKNIYEQQKFNLLREENEGYSKVIIELTQSNIHESNIEIVRDNILSLIGYFNLDPNRVLDIILDIFECCYENLNYLKLLRLFKASALPQLLGLKFQNYAKLNTKEAAPKNDKIISFDHTPHSLYKVTAVLIREKMIDIPAIWCHLSPSDSELETIQKERIEIAEAIYKKTNMIRLGSAGDKAAEEKQKEKEKDSQDIVNLRKDRLDNQKIWLLEALVGINAWEHVDIVFGYLRKVIDIASHSPLRKTLFDLLHWSIEPIYRNISPSKFASTHKPSIKEYPAYSSESKINHIKESTDFNVFLNEAPKVLRIINIYLSFDPVLYAKICRVIKHHMVLPEFKDNSEAKETINLMCSKSFLPALSLINCNPGLVHELWSLIEHIDCYARYGFYEEWMTKAYLSCPLLIIQSASITKETSRWLKTLSKENERKNGRSLGKFCHNNPCLVFNIVLSQIQVYDNQIQPLIAALTYCSNLCFDVIGYLLIRQLSNTNKDRLNQDDASVASWLANLANFSGHFFKKHYWIDLSGIMTYLKNRAKMNEVVELEFLKELIARMSGWTSLDSEEMSENQLQSLAGGFLLRIESANLTNEFKSTKKSGHALTLLYWKKTNLDNSKQREEIADENTQMKDIEEKAELSLAVSLLVSMGQKQEWLLYNTRTEQLKLLGGLYDRVHYLLIQFTEFLNFHADSAQHYAQLLPPERPLNIIVNDYNLPPEVAFFIYRPSMKAIHLYSQGEYESLRDQFKSSLDRYMEMSVAKVDTQGIDSIYFDEKKYLMERSIQIWNCISPDIYFVFWALSLGDIYVPNERYKAEIEKLNKEVSRLQEQNSLTDTGSSQIAKNKKIIEKLKLSASSLNQEHTKLKEKVTNVENFIKSKKDEFLSNISKGNQGDISTVLTQQCLFPRLKFSPGDSIFVVKFIALLQRLKTPYINILDILGKLLKGVLPFVQCCTEKESFNLGIFFLELFKIIENWQKESVWNTECSNTPGFSRNLSSSECISLGDFKSAINNIYTRVAVYLIKCLKSEEYMQSRNALVVLIKLSTSVFPNTKNIAHHIEKRVNRLIETTKKEDLKTMALRYQTTLKKLMETLPSDDQNAGRRAKAEGLQDKQSPDADRKKGKQEGLDKQDPKALNNNKKRREDDKDKNDRKKKRDEALIAREEGSRDTPEKSQQSKKKRGDTPEVKKRSASPSHTDHQYRDVKRKKQEDKKEEVKDDRKDERKEERKEDRNERKEERKESRKEERKEDRNNDRKDERNNERNDRKEDRANERKEERPDRKEERPDRKEDRTERKEERATDRKEERNNERKEDKVNDRKEDRNNERKEERGSQSQSKEYRSVQSNLNESNGLRKEMT